MRPPITSRDAGSRFAPLLLLALFLTWCPQFQSWRSGGVLTIGGFSCVGVCWLVEAHPFRWPMRCQDVGRRLYGGRCGVRGRFLQLGCGLAALVMWSAGWLGLGGAWSWCGRSLVTFRPLYGGGACVPGRIPCLAVVRPMVAMPAVVVLFLKTRSRLLLVLCLLRVKILILWIGRWRRSGVVPFLKASSWSSCALAVNLGPRSG